MCQKGGDLPELWQPGQPASVSLAESCQTGQQLGALWGLLEMQLLLESDSQDQTGLSFHPQGQPTHSATCVQTMFRTVQRSLHRVFTTDNVWHHAAELLRAVLLLKGLPETSGPHWKWQVCSEAEETLETCSSNDVIFNSQPLSQVRQLQPGLLWKPSLFLTLERCWSDRRRLFKSRLSLIYVIRTFNVVALLWYHETFFSGDHFWFFVGKFVRNDWLLSLFVHCTRSFDCVTM